MAIESEWSSPRVERGAAAAAWRKLLLSAPPSWFSISALPVPPGGQALESICLDPWLASSWGWPMRGEKGEGDRSGYSSACQSFLISTALGRRGSSKPQLLCSVSFHQVPLMSFLCLAPVVTMISHLTVLSHSLTSQPSPVHVR